ncbi:MAG: PP2C family protein-serine/threonine phosphatase [Solirubrobacterales bacterium]
MTALLGASVLAAALVWAGEREDADDANRARARQAAAVAQRTIQLTAASLRGGEGVLRRSGPMPERGFRRFAREVIAETPFPSLEWSPRVSGRERRSFERALRRPIAEPRPPTKRHPEGDLRPVARHNGAYLPIRIVHPDESDERSLLGLDLLSEPARGLAVRASRDSGVPMITSPLFTPQRSDPVVVLFEPVYEPGAPLRNRRQRQLALRGVLSGEIAAGAIAREISEQIGFDGALAITDGEAALVAGPAAVSGGDVPASVEVLGRRWELWLEDVERPAALPALAVGGTGVALAALVAALFTLAGRREQLLGRERDSVAAEAETQRRIAHTLQQALLPPSLPEIAGVETAVIYRAGADGLEVGGDFYDLFATGESWTAVIGDVSGKGAKAAALTALVRHTARAFAERGPAAAVEQVDRAIWREGKREMFATLVVASLERTTAALEIEVVVAGHPPPFVIRSDGTVSSVQTTAPLVGAIDAIEVGQVSLEIAVGETLLLYTDGLTEARGPSQGRFGEDGVRQVIKTLAGAAPEQLIDGVLARAREFSPDFPEDDVAILAIRATPV